MRSKRSGDIKIGLASKPDATQELEVPNERYSPARRRWPTGESSGLVLIQKFRQSLVISWIRHRLDVDPGCLARSETLTTMAVLKATDGNYLLA